MKRRERKRRLGKGRKRRKNYQNKGRKIKGWRSRQLNLSEPLTINLRDDTRPL